MKNRFLPMLLAAALLPALCACKPKESVASPPITPSVSATPTPEVTPASSPVPVFTTDAMQEIYFGEDPQYNEPFPGIVVSFRLDMPRIENTTENPGWEQINQSISLLGEGWIQKSPEYIGSPGLKPGGNYWVEGSYTIERIDKVISIRYPRTEQLAAWAPARTVMANTFDADTGEFLNLGDFFRIADTESDHALTRRLAEEAAALNMSALSQEELAWFSGFYFTGDSLVLLYPVWDGGATSPTSTLELPIPLSRLSDIANERLPPTIPSSFPVLERDYPPELQELLRGAVNDDIAELKEDYNITCADFRITGAKKLCRVYINEGHAELWQIDYALSPSRTDSWDRLPRPLDGNGVMASNRLAVVRTDPTGSYSHYYGSLLQEDISDLKNVELCEKAVLELCWSITDMEFSLWRDGFPGYSGLGGNGVNFIAPYEGSEHTEERLPWKVFVAGDHWQRDSWKGLTAVSIVSPSEARQYLYSIDTTLTDVKTYRGIGLGATHEEVMAVYPEIAPDNWPVEEWGNQLVYESMPGQPFGSFLHFYFGKDGKVNRIMIELIVD